MWWLDKWLFSLNRNKKINVIELDKAKKITRGEYADIVAALWLLI